MPRLPRPLHANSYRGHCKADPCSPQGHLWRARGRRFKNNTDSFETLGWGSSMNADEAEQSDNMPQRPLNSPLCPSSSLRRKSCKHNAIEKFPCHGKRIKWLPRCCRCTEPRASGKVMCGPLHDTVFRGLHRARRWKLPLRPSFGYAFSTFSSSTAMSADYCLLFFPRIF